MERFEIHCFASLTNTVFVNDITIDVEAETREAAKWIAMHNLVDKFKFFGFDADYTEHEVFATGTDFEDVFFGFDAD